MTLNGATSTGNIDAYEWTGPDGIAITGANSPQAKFTAPSTPGDYEFTLKVTGPDGSSGAVTSKTDTVIVHVNEIRTAVAKIAFANAVIAPGATLTVPQNQSITLDGGQSVGAAAFSWSQVSGPAVSLGATNGQTVTFTVPKTTQDIKLALQVRNPGVTAQNCTATSCATVQITLRPQPDTLAITTARFVANSSRWRIDGTATSTTNNKVTVYSGLALNPALRVGTADVLADGTWSVDARDSTIPVTTCQCVTVVSDRGGQIVDFPLEKPQNLPPTTVDPGDPPRADAGPARHGPARRGRSAGRPRARGSALRRSGGVLGRVGRDDRRAGDGGGARGRQPRPPAGPDDREQGAVLDLQEGQGRHEGEDDDPVEQAAQEAAVGQALRARGPRGNGEEPPRQADAQGDPHPLVRTAWDT